MKRYFTSGILALFIVTAGFSEELVLQQGLNGYSGVTDNTIFEENTNSNGVGSYIFVGKTARSLSRRALIRFDVSAIPSGSIIQNVELRVRVSKTISNPNQVSAHRLLASWGVGTSNASGEEGTGAAATNNDATWQHRFFPNDRWTQNGGDFTAAASGSGMPQLNQVSAITGAGMISDVQAWVDNPDTNFGWILIGTETGVATAKRINASESTIDKPQLVITYEEPVSVQDWSVY